MPIPERLRQTGVVVGLPGPKTDFGKKRSRTVPYRGPHARRWELRDDRKYVTDHSLNPGLHYADTVRERFAERSRAWAYNPDNNWSDSTSPAGCALAERCSS